MTDMISLAGKAKVTLRDGSSWSMQLPGTLDENGIGYKDLGTNQWHPEANIANQTGEIDENAPIATRFTRKYTYEGEAKISLNMSDFCSLSDIMQNSFVRTFIEVERARCLSLYVDKKEIPHHIPWSLSTPHVFEVTGVLKNDSIVTFASDNSYPGLPASAIKYSSAATDETQTNWNGLLGYVRIRQEQEIFISQLRVYPVWNKQQECYSFNIEMEIDASRDWSGEVQLCSEAFVKEHCEQVTVRKGINRFSVISVAAKKDCKEWNLQEGNLYTCKASLTNLNSVKEVSFGIRRFGDNGEGRLAINGRTFFLRGEANCAEFPEEGHVPMEVDRWKEILSLYASYGINCMRFHSHCPSEAAFIAADELGMLMQPELSHWDPKSAFESEESFSYYQQELTCIYEHFANHPSFVMLTLGNELQTSSETGAKRMHALVKLGQSLDKTRLIANGSNPFYGEHGPDPDSDFYTSQNFEKEMIRGVSAGMEGHVNRCYPNARTNYDKALQAMRKVYNKPVFSFEVGQYEVLPDFSELDRFHGVSKPDNYEIIQKKARECGISEEKWKRYVEATGELSLIGYREEVEAAMRTRELSGISLLGLQDFPGQGTAIVGMINAHMESKPFSFAKPERFHAFFRDARPLVLLEKYTYEATESLHAEVVFANYKRQYVTGEATYELLTENGMTLATGRITVNGKEVDCPQGTHTKLGDICIDFTKCNQELLKTARACTLRVTKGEESITYPIWVYPKVKPQCPSNVYETKILDEAAKNILKQGGTVYLSPDATQEDFPLATVQAQFSTDFWSVGTFPFQTGCMGQLIEDKHPIFDAFPTSFHTDWQWYPMATKKAFVLPKAYECIVTEIDSYAYMKPMAQLIEGTYLGGHILICAMDLQNSLQYPECRCLQQAIYDYLGQGSFACTQDLTEVFDNNLK